MQSCKDCPSYLSGDQAQEQHQRFQRNAGGPMCGRFGHILGSSKSTDGELDAIANHFAMNCEGYGQSLPAEPEEHYSRVADADPALLGATSGIGDPMVKTCKKCENCVTEETVYQHFGWTLPLCRAKGNLIFRALNEARECAFAKAGQPSESTVGITLRNVYQPGFRIEDKVAVQAYVAVNGDVDPTEYVSDAEVTEAHRAEGIRAWRLVTDHQTGNEVYAPIFDTDTFSEEERLLIPTTGSEGHPELYIDYSDLLYSFFVETVELKETPVLVGPPGVGKTQLGRYVAWLCNMPFRRIQFVNEMDPAEFLGATAYTEGVGTHFEPGILPQAWQSKGVLDLDEPNLGPDSCTQVLRPMTDNSKELIIENHHFPREKWCLMYMAMNPSYDMRNLGTKELADADTNRLSFLEVQLPPEPVEREIIRSYCRTLDNYELPDRILDKMMLIAADIRAAEEAGTYPSSWGTRQQIKVARKTKWYALGRAYYVAALNNMPEDVRDIVQSALDTHLGE